MSKLTGKKLLESHLDGVCPVRVEDINANEINVRMPVSVPDNPRKDVPIPENMQHLPIEERGYRVPYFVSWVNGKPDFRCVEPGTVVKCVRNKLCWVCGKPHPKDDAGLYPQTYVIGPMCSINHVSAEPGSHIECARYAARVCPFLVAPGMRRNDKNLPEDSREPGGLFIKRNPGVMALWTTPIFRVIPEGESVLFRIGKPIHLEFWREGRFATRAEINESISTGLPILQEEARQQGPKAIAELERMVVEAHKLIDQFI